MMYHFTLCTRMGKKKKAEYQQGYGETRTLIDFGENAK
jgi:hypothetical protein